MELRSYGDVLGKLHVCIILVNYQFYFIAFKHFHLFLKLYL